MPTSPVDAEGSSHETPIPGRPIHSQTRLSNGRLLTSPASLLSEIHGASSVTSIGNSQIDAEEPKSPVSEAPSRTISIGSDSDTVADDQGAFEPAPSHFQHVSDESQRGPTIDDTQPPHADSTETPAPINGTTRPPSPISDSPGVRPPPLRITTNPPLEPRSSGFPGTTYFTPEVRVSRTFNSAATVQVEFSDPNSASQDVGDTDHKVVDVQPASGRVRSRHLLSIPPLEPPRRRGSGRRPNTDSSWETIGVEPRHGLRIPLAPPSRNSQGFSHLQERLRDSTFSFSSSPFDEFRSDAGPSQRIPEAEIPTILIQGRESGSRQPRSRSPSRDEGTDIGDREAAFPRSGTKRAVPRWGSTKGTSEGRQEEKGKERGDRSYTPTPTANIPTSNEVEDPSWDLNLTPVSPARSGMWYTTQDAVSILVQRPDPSFFKSVLTKLGVPESSQLLRSSLPLKRSNSHSSKLDSNMRNAKAAFKGIFGGHKGPHG